MSQFGKKGGVSIFQKCLKFKNVPKVGGGGEGSTLIGTLSQIFSIFYFDASPRMLVVDDCWLVYCKDHVDLFAG